MKSKSRKKKQTALRGDRSATASQTRARQARGHGARPKRPFAPNARAPFKAKLGRAPAPTAQSRGETKPPSRRPAPAMRPDLRLEEGTRKPDDPILNPPAGARSLRLRLVRRAPKAFGKRIGPARGGPEAGRPALAFFRRRAAVWACARPSASRAVRSACSRRLAQAGSSAWAWGQASLCVFAQSGESVVAQRSPAFGESKRNPSQPGCAQSAPKADAGDRLRRRAFESGRSARTAPGRRTRRRFGVRPVRPIGV